MLATTHISPAPPRTIHLFLTLTKAGTATGLPTNHGPFNNGINIFFWYQVYLYNGINIPFNKYLRTDVINRPPLIVSMVASDQKINKSERTTCVVSLIQKKSLWTSHQGEVWFTCCDRTRRRGVI